MEEEIENLFGSRNHTEFAMKNRSMNFTNVRDHQEWKKDERVPKKQPMAKLLPLQKIIFKLLHSTGGSKAADGRHLELFM